ncbi:MAG: SufD family Fe-S cluster assembly protein [Eubacterium sp.]|nr:SufD family Fe-S cluster assembly protein [Eubacterium sp.]
MTEKIVNQLPSKTWYWLKINDSRFQWNEDQNQALEEVKIQASKGQVADPVTLVIDEDYEYATKHIVIEAEEDSQVTVYVTYKTEKNLAVITDMKAAKNARIRLVQTQMSKENSLIFNKVQGQIEEKAKIEVIQFYLGRGRIYTDNQMDLMGKKSESAYDIAYLGQGQDLIDINVVLNHYGVKSHSETYVGGALKDASKKIFRGTIDFKNGASKATGDEQETVLLLGDQVHNLTIPVILCAEEDVSGTHGASIGELDEETLFYFESRGIDQKTAENIMARASVERLIRKLEDQGAQNQVQQILCQVL